MKTLCSIAVVGLVVLLLATPCAEAARDGHDLLEQCRDGMQTTRETFKAGYCAGFVSGVLDMHMAWFGVSGSNLRSWFCLPGQGIILEQATRLVLYYLETHPERLHIDRMQLVLEAMRDA